MIQIHEGQFFQGELMLIMNLILLSITSIKLEVMSKSSKAHFVSHFAMFFINAITEILGKKPLPGVGARVAGVRPAWYGVEWCLARA
jgi:hypothetical protein